MIVICLSCICFISKLSFAQTFQTYKRKISRKLTTPGLQGQAPSKGISIEWGSTPDFHMDANAYDNLKHQKITEVENLRRIDAKVRAPLWNSNGLKVVLGLRYSEERFFFEEDEVREIGSLTNELESKALKRMGSELIVLKPLRFGNYVAIRSALNFNGDYTGWQGIRSDYFSYNFSALWGHKKHDATEYGFGFQFNKGLDRWNLYPVILYNHNFSDKWGIEALLPKRLALRYNHNPKTILSTQLEIKGSSYRVSLPDESDASKQLVFDMAEFRSGLVFQKELFPILWLEAEAGYRKSLICDFSQDRESIIEASLQSGPYVGIGVFLTPPRR